MIYRVILLLLLCASSQAQTFNAAPFQGAGNTGIALKSIYSITNNASGLVHIKSPTLAIAYQPHFLSSDISTQALYLAIPLKRSNTFGLSMNNYGLAGVSSLLTISGAYVRAFGAYFSTSASLNYHSFNIKSYGRDQTFSVDLGFQISILEQLDIGAIFRNISNEMFAEDIDQYLASEIGFGIKYDISRDIILTTDLYYDAIQNLNVRSGIAYNIAKAFLCRAGVSSGPIQFFAGLGIDMGQFKIDCSSAFHAQLGSSPQIALSYAF